MTPQNNQNPLHQRYESLLAKVTERKDEVQQLVNMLHNETTWLTSPASTRYHLNVEEGLLLHSVGVAETLLRIKDTLAPDISDESCVGVVTMLMHTSGQWLQQEYVLPMTKRDPQAAGSAITYARRYALQSMAGIPTADDDAEAAMMRGEDITRKISEQQAETVKEMLQVTNSDVEKFCKAFKCSTVDQMQVQYYDRAMAALQSKMK